MCRTGSNRASHRLDRPSPPSSEDIDPPMPPDSSRRDLPNGSETFWRLLLFHEKLTHSVTSTHSCVYVEVRHEEEGVPVECAVVSPPRQQTRTSINVSSQAWSNIFKLSLRNSSVYVADLEEGVDRESDLSSSQHQEPCLFSFLASLRPPDCFLDLGAHDLHEPFRNWEMHGLKLPSCTTAY